jgi:MFS family permease
VRAAESPPSVFPRASHNVRAVLAVRGFRRLVVVRVLSQIADGWFQSGLAGSVLFNPEKQTSPVAIATGFAVLLLPYSLIGPYVGVFLDRWSRRTVIHLTNVFRALLVVPVVFMIWWGNEGTIFPLLAFAIIGLNRFFLAGVNAATPHVVEDRRLVTANALSGTLGSVCYSAGFGSSVLLLRVAGIPATFHGYAVIAALAPFGYLASALLANASFRRDELGPDATERRDDRLLAGLVDVFRGMIAGIRHLADKRGAAYALIAQAGFRALYGVLALATLLLFRRYFVTGADFGGSIAGLGLVFGVGSLGVLVAAFLTPPVTRRVGGWRWITWLLGLTGVTILVCGLPFQRELLLLAVFVVNVAAQSTKIVVDTALQHECADEYRGRVFSVNDTSFNLCFVGGLYLAAVTLPDNGKSAPALLLVAVGYLLVAGWYTVVGGRWARKVGDDIAGPPRPAGPAA